AQQLHVEQTVSLVDGDGVDARRPRTRIRFERGLLHRALLGAEHEEGIL
nr:hypothetical protein [Tanacetum cinerariifolium]